jgi:hypothetical protein
MGTNEPCRRCFRMVVFRACPDAVGAVEKTSCAGFETPQTGLKKAIEACERAYWQTAAWLLAVGVLVGGTLVDYLLQ